MIQKNPETIVETCQFKVVVDTREQAPWRFTGHPLPIVETITDRALKTGDYSIAGLEHRFAIERKSVNDFYHSIGSDRERFEREMVRLANMDFAAVVIEGDWMELTVDRPDTIRMSVKAAVNTVASWSIRYGVHFMPCPSRRFAEIWSFRLMEQFWKQVQKEGAERA